MATSTERAAAPKDEPAGKPRSHAAPKWEIEKAIESIGRAPAAVGRVLDRAAKVPILGLAVGFFSSVWLGLLWLALIGIYIAVGSGVTSVRAHFEMTDMDFFNAWPMQVLLALMCTTLIVVTLRRVRLTVFKLGVWTVHTGLLTLVLGCVIYFSNKVEGLTQIYLHRSTNSFYDSAERALYFYRVDDGGNLSDESMVPLPKLPLYHEYTTETGNPLDRAIPADVLARVDPKLAGVPVRVTGYYPYAFMQPTAAAGPSIKDALSPGVALKISVEEATDIQWIYGTSPATRIMDAPAFGLEYLYHPTPQKLRDITTSFDSFAAVTVRVPKRGVEQVCVLTKDKPDATIEGTPYTISAVQLTPPMPMLSAGYKGAQSTGILLEVTRAAADGVPAMTFQRQVLFRFPEISPDFVTGSDGQQKRVQSRVDNDLEIVLHDSQSDQFWIVEGDDGKLTLVRRAKGGKVEQRPIDVGQSSNVTLGGRMPMRLTVVGRSNNVVLFPVIVPPQQREQQRDLQQTLALSIVEVTVGSGDGAQKAYMRFTQFCQTVGNRGVSPTVVDVPGVGKIAMVLSTTRRPLPSTVTLLDFKAVKAPGVSQRSRMYTDYVNTLQITDPKSGNRRTVVTQLNSPIGDNGMYYFPAQWDGSDSAGDEARFTVLGAGNRPGVYVMTGGAVLMLIGVIFGFYVKPLLMEKKKRELAAWAAGGGAPAGRSAE